jgi:hypothetical protein
MAAKTRKKAQLRGFRVKKQEKFKKNPPVDRIDRNLSFEYPSGL